MSEPKSRAIVCLEGDFTKTEAEEMAYRLSNSSIIEVNGVKRKWQFIALELGETT